jgi:hypothetical protein
MDKSMIKRPSLAWSLLIDCMPESTLFPPEVVV